MTEGKRRHFSAQEKAEILKEHLKGRKPISEVCERHDIHPTVFHRWHMEMLDNCDAAFERKGKVNNTRQEQRIAELERKLVRKNEVLSELMEEHVALKKSLGES